MLSAMILLLLIAGALAWYQGNRNPNLSRWIAVGALGLLLLGVCKATIPALVVAMAQDSAGEGHTGAASGLIMSMHYVAAFSSPVIAAQLIAGLGNMVWAMILASALPFVVFGTLIAMVRVRPLGAG